MGDENSLQGRTQAHKHELESSTGGYLAEGLTGITGGLVNEVLTNDGTDIPVWASIPTPASGAWAEIGNDINTVKGLSLDVTVTDADVYQVLYNVASGGDESAPVLALRVNDVTTSSYTTLAQWGSTGATTESEARTKTKWLCSIGGGDDGYSGVAYVYKSDSNFPADSQGGATFLCNTQQISSTAPLYVVYNMGTNTSITGAITKITLVVMNENNDDNAQIVGSMRVDSLSYS